MENAPVFEGASKILGLTGYYRKYVAGYARIAQSLTEQLQKDGYGWKEAATRSFIQLKQAMT